MVVMSNCSPAGTVNRIFIRCDIFQEIKTEVHDLMEQKSSNNQDIYTRQRKGKHCYVYLLSLLMSLLQLVTGWKSGTYRAIYIFNTLDEGVPVSIPFHFSQLLEY